MSSHREAPEISKDPVADSSDLYAFVSPDAPDTVTIKMPKAIILSSKLDNDKTYVYDRQTGLFNKPDPNLETQIRQVAEQQIVQTAMEDDILGKAQKNAEDVIRTLVNGLGYADVRFVEGP